MSGVLKLELKALLLLLKDIGKRILSVTCGTKRKFAKVNASLVLNFAL